MKNDNTEVIKNEESKPTVVALVNTPAVVKPADETIATNVEMVPKKNVNFLYDFDLETLYLDHKKTKYTSEYFAQWFDFSVKNNKEKEYVLTNDDLKHLKFTNITYDDNHLKLYVNYNGIDKKEPLVQNFKLDEYYLGKVIINKKTI